MNKKLISVLLYNALIYILSMCIIMFFGDIIITIITICIGILCMFGITILIFNKYKDEELRDALYITNVTHQMRNPLAKISGNAQIISITNDCKEIDNIMEEVVELDSLISEFIKVSIVIETANSKVDTNISNFLINECEKLKSISTKKVDYNIEKNIIWKSNDNNINTLFSTLLDNANKYSKKYINCTASNNSIKIINDTTLSDGCYDNIFERFKRINSDTVGFGVGLSVVLEIVKYANKRITANVINNEMIIEIK